MLLAAKLRNNLGQVVHTYVPLSPSSKRARVMDEQSGESEEEEVTGEGIGESEIKGLVPE